MRFSEKLREDAIAHEVAAKALMPALNVVGKIKFELQTLAAMLPNDSTEKAALIEAIGRLPSSHGETLVQAVTGLVMAKMYWLMADQTEYLISRDVLHPPRSEAAERRSKANAQIRGAVLKGFSDGDWSALEGITERLAGGDAIGATPEVVANP